MFFACYEHKDYEQVHVGVKRGRRDNQTNKIQKKTITS